MIIVNQNGLVNGEAVTPENVGRLLPDGYLTETRKTIPFHFFKIPENIHSNEYKALEDVIAANGGTAVGLIFEVASTPHKVEIDSIWWEINSMCEGLEIKMSLVDIEGTEIEPIAGAEALTFDQDPCEVDTFCKYRFDNAADAGKIGRGNSAIVRIEILAEPEGGLLGSLCDSGCNPCLDGGLNYDGFCIQRNVIIDDCGCLNECADCPTPEGEEAYAGSPRAGELA